MVKITEELVRKKSEHNECLISTLEEIALHQEDIERIVHLQNWCRDLKILLLQSNLIPKIENLYKLKRLEYLNLAVNNIERVENLEALESLTKLDLTLNFIGELTSLESLAGNYNLRELVLTGNPCTDYPNYREYVIGALPQLNILDCEEIKLSDKLKARKRLKEYRDRIVQKQADYGMQRDEQKIRFLQQKQELEARMASMEDEDDRIKAFWDSKSEHCPEIRTEIARYHNMCRNKPDANAEKASEKPQTHLFAPCGRPYNVNKPKLPFTLKDEADAYCLELGIYKYLDTSMIDADIQPNYIRVSVKGKIFQMYLAEEVKPSESTVQRSQITGQLTITTPKLRANEVLRIQTKKDVGACKDIKERRNNELKGTVDIGKICSQDLQVPELI